MLDPAVFLLKNMIPALHCGYLKTCNNGLLEGVMNACDLNCKDETVK